MRRTRAPGVAFHGRTRYGRTRYGRRITYVEPASESPLLCTSVTRRWVPDLLVVARDPERYVTDDGLGLTAAGVRGVCEVTSPGKRSLERDRVKKRREYARASIPVYVLIDDYDGQGAVTLFTGPRPGKADWEDIHRVPYGTAVTIPEGPAKGFVIGEAVTGPKRG